MAYRYTDEDEKLLEASATEDSELDEELKLEEGIEEKKPLDETEYYDLPAAPEKRNRLFSVISLVCSLLSIALCAFYYVSLPFAVAAIVCAVISRRTLGYFDRLSVAGLLLGMVGVVFSAFSMIVDLTGVLDALK